MQREKTRARAPSLGRFKTRIRFIAVFFGVVAVICVARLYQLQLLQGRYYAERASNEFTLPSNEFDRGTIYFTTRDGAHIAAATTEDGIAIGLNPQKISATSSERVYEKLNELAA